MLKSTKNETHATREYYILKNYPHENIVKLIAAVQSKTNVYLIMERCEMDLEHYYKKYKLKEEQIREVARQIVNGLVHLLSKGVIHRDLKPENILITSKRIIKIADFGSGRQLSEFEINDPINKPTCDSQSGTIKYNAPEKMQGLLNYTNGKYSSPSDIFSLGCIILELYNGKSVFGSFRFPSKYEDYPMKTSVMSIEAVDLITKMLQSDVKKRIDWSQITSHSYFTNSKLTPFNLKPQPNLKLKLTKNGESIFNTGMEYDFGLPKLDEIKKENPIIMHIKKSDIPCTISNETLASDLIDKIREADEQTLLSQLVKEYEMIDPEECTDLNTAFIKELPCMDFEFVN